MTTTQKIKSTSKARSSALTGRNLAPRPIFYPPPRLRVVLNTVTHRAEDTLLLSSQPLSRWTLLTSFSFPISSPNTLSQNTMLNHETLTRYKSSFLLLGHSNRPSSLSFVLFIFTTTTNTNTTTPPSHILYSCSPPYTNTTLINCGTGNYTEPTGKFHFHLHLDCGIFHSYQSAAQDQCVAGLAHMQTQLFMAFLYSYRHSYRMDTHTKGAHMFLLNSTQTRVRGCLLAHTNGTQSYLHTYKHGEQ